MEKNDQKTMELAPEGLPKALRDVLARTPKSVTVETKKPVAGAMDEQEPWSGNVYKYNY